MTMTAPPKSRRHLAAREIEKEANRDIKEHSAAYNITLGQAVAGAFWSHREINSVLKEPDYSDMLTCSRN